MHGYPGVCLAVVRSIQVVEALSSHQDPENAVVMALVNGTTCCVQFLSAVSNTNHGDPITSGSSRDQAFFVGSRSRITRCAGDDFEIDDTTVASVVEDGCMGFLLDMGFIRSVSKRSI